MLEITENEPKEKEIKDAIKYLLGLLEKIEKVKLDKEELEKNRKSEKMTMEEIIKLASKELDSAPVPECEGFYMEISGKIKRIDKNSTDEDKKAIIDKFSQFQ